MGAGRPCCVAGGTLPGTGVAVACPGARLCYGVTYSTPSFSVCGVRVSRGRGASPAESDRLVLVSFTECEKVCCLTTLNKRRNNSEVFEESMTLQEARPLRAA